MKRELFIARDECHGCFESGCANNLNLSRFKPSVLSVVKKIFTLRRGGMDDLDAIFRLNQQVFAEYWSFQSLYAALSTGYDLLLCESDEGLAGYLLSMSVLDEVQIMQIAIVASFRRQGLAARMTNHLIEEKAAATKISLEVRDSNRAARQLYAGLGFVENGCRKNYYSPDINGRREDAILMDRHLA